MLRRRSLSSCRRRRAAGDCHISRSSVAVGNNDSSVTNDDIHFTSQQATHLWLYGDGDSPDTLVPKIKHRLSHDGPDHSLINQDNLVPADGTRQSRVEHREFKVVADTDEDATVSDGLPLKAVGGVAATLFRLLHLGL